MLRDRRHHHSYHFSPDVPALLLLLLILPTIVRVVPRGFVIMGIAALAFLQAASLSPQKLFRRCADIPNDDWAWQEFNKRYQQALQIGICRFIGFPPSKKFHQYFADALQNVYVRLLQNERRALLAFRGQSEGEAHAYLRRIAGSVALNLVRQRNLIFPTPDGELPELPVPADFDNEILDRLSVDKVLQQELRGRNKYRNILAYKLHAYEKCNAAEIASVLGMALTARAVDNQVSRIRKRLAGVLKKD